MYAASSQEEEEEEDEEEEEGEEEEEEDKTEIPAKNSAKKLGLLFLGSLQRSGIGECLERGGLP